MAQVTYVVQKGDNLSKIARKYGTTVKAIQALNPTLIKNVNYICTGWTIVVSGDPGKSVTASPTSYITDLKLGQLSNSEDTVLAVWSWKWHSKTDHYLLKWMYSWGIGTYKTEERTTKDLCDTYSPPSLPGVPLDRMKVSVTVTPIPITTKDANGKEKTAFTAKESNRVLYQFKNNIPSNTPSAPDVEIEDYKLTAKVTNIPDTVTEVEFVVVKDNSNSTYKTNSIRVMSNQATYTITIEAGGSYKVKCRYINENGEGPWSPWSGESTTKPNAPSGIKTCRAESETSVYLDWNAVENATSYDIEYSEKREYLEGSNQTSTQSNIKSTSYIISGLESGKEYFFRLRAVNSQGESAWTRVVSVIIGTEPAAPTTWSSNTTVVTGEQLTLYWVHNSEDGSAQTKANVEMTFYGMSRLPSEYLKDDIKVENFESLPVTGVYDKIYTTLDDGKSYQWQDVKIDDGGEEFVSKYVSVSTSGVTFYHEIDTSSEKDDEKTMYYAVGTSDFIEGATILWRVQTAGATKKYGDWSVQRTVKVYAPPTISINILDVYGNEVDSTDRRLNSFPFRIIGSAGPKTQTPVGYHISIISNTRYEIRDYVGMEKIVNAGEEIYSKYIDSSSYDLSVELSAGDIDLVNNASYTVNCVLSMDSGLTGNDSRNFAVNWNGIGYEPNAETSINKDDLTALVMPYCEDGNGNLIEDVVLSVYRREFDGSFTEIMTGLENVRGHFITDPHPALDYARYRIVARSKTTGSVSYYDMPGLPVGEKAVVVQWDEEWRPYENFDYATDQIAWSGSMLKLPYNIDISESNTIDKSLVEYIGRKHPVSYYGTQVGQTQTWNVDIPKTDTETIYALRRLSVWMGDVYIREPSGSGYWANVSVSFSQKHRETTIPVKFSITRVAGGM